MMGCGDSYKRKYPTFNKDNAYNGPNSLQPGPCPQDPQTGEPVCPPPTEMVCIKTEKVYESCQKAVTNEEVADLTNIAVGQIIDVECKDPQLVINEEFPFVCEKIPGTNRARVRFFYQYRFAFLDQESWKQFTSEPIFVEQVVFFSDRIFDPQIFVQCEVFLVCFDIFPSGPQEVTVCIGKQLIFKLVALVQLLIPAYGFCPEPDPCPQVLEECPEFVPLWPPFPPQDNDVNNKNRNFL